MLIVDTEIMAGTTLVYSASTSLLAMYELCAEKMGAGLKAQWEEGLAYIVNIHMMQT